MQGCKPLSLLWFGLDGLSMRMETTEVQSEESLGTMRSSGVCWYIPFSRSLQEHVDLPQWEREDAGKTLRCGESTFEVVGIKGGQSEFHWAARKNAGQGQPGPEGPRGGDLVGGESSLHTWRSSERRDAGVQRRSCLRNLESPEVGTVHLSCK